MHERHHHHLNEQHHPAIRIPLANRAIVSELLGREIHHTPASSNAEQYPHKHKWDVLFAVMMKARYGHAEDAVREILDLFAGQRDDGLVPSPQFVENLRDIDLERETFTDRDASEYGQPPIEALAALKVYEGLMIEDKQDQGEEFLLNIYSKLAASYTYFARDRQHADPRIKLIFNTHPSETGRDSDPTFDFFKVRLPTFGENTPHLIQEANRVTNFFSMIALNEMNRQDGWETQKIRERFEVYDVMFNCMYAENLNHMATLAKELAAIAVREGDETAYLKLSEDAEHWQQLASTVEQQILDLMWFENTNPKNPVKGLFLALKPEGPIEEVSISNLFPLILPNLRQEQLESILFLLDNYFCPKDIVELPIPSVPPINPITNRPNRKYDPYNGERDTLWRGDTWMNTNWYLVKRGLAMQASRADLQHSPDLIEKCNHYISFISERSYKTVVGVGSWEHYGPEDARPHRTDKSPNFAWSGLAYWLYEDFLAADRDSLALAA
ncbi:MAG TPA: hypothetical protein VEH48_02180 [Candidatus Nitrosopolaris sp.]|nr:hypothetical protein [Candidatus Nitrosopolaris sp.]